VPAPITETFFIMIDSDFEILELGNFEFVLAISQLAISQFRN